MKVILFDSLSEAEAALTVIEENLRTQLLNAGAAEDESGHIIPHNAATGKPDYTATRTLRWDEPHLLEDGRYFLHAPSNIELLAGLDIEITEQ